MDLWNQRQYRLPAMANMRTYAGLSTSPVAWGNADSDRFMVFNSIGQAMGAPICRPSFRQPTMRVSGHLPLENSPVGTLISTQEFLGEPGTNVLDSHITGYISSLTRGAASRNYPTSYQHPLPPKEGGHRRSSPATLSPCGSVCRDSGALRRRPLTRCRGR